MNNHNSEGGKWWGSMWILSIFLIFLFSCGNTENVIYQRIIPQGNDKITLGTLEKIEETITINDDEKSLIRFSLPAPFVVLDYLRDNLDIDDNEEDIILYTRYDIDSPYVLIASYNTKLNKYQFNWQSQTNLNVKKSVSLYVKDITGDSRKEIVVEGYSQEGKKLIEVFHLPLKTYDVSQYKKVFSKTATDIQIQEVARNAQYREGRTYGVSYLLVLYDIEEDKSITKSYYNWDRNTVTYVYKNSEKFTYTNIIQQKLSDLYVGDSETWKDFLNGLWVKKKDDTIFIEFSNSRPGVVFYNSQEIQSYAWRSVARTISNEGIGGRIRMQNILFPSVRKWMHVQTLSEDEITISLDYDISGSVFNGVYKHITSEEATGFLRSIKGGRNVKDRLIRLSGSFESTKDSLYYIFEYPILKVLGQKSQSNNNSDDTSSNTEVIWYFDFFMIEDITVLEVRDFKEKSGSFFVVENDDDRILLTPVHIAARTIYPLQNSPSIGLKEIIQ